MSGLVDLQKENIKLHGKLDAVCLILNQWNRKEISAEHAFTELYKYIGSDVSGALKRRELMKNAVKII